MAVRAKGEFFQPLGQPVWYVLGPVARYVARDLHDARDVCLLPFVKGAGTGGHIAWRARASDWVLLSAQGQPAS
jgi:hypothetical protein